MTGEPRELRDYDQWKRGLRNYEWLHGVVPGCTDIDVFVERRQRFFLIEGKHWSKHGGVYLPLGQQIALTQLVTLNALTGLDTFTVYLVGEEIAEGNEAEAADVFHVMRFGKATPAGVGGGGAFYPPALFDDANRDDLRQVVRTWIESA